MRVFLFFVGMVLLAGPVVADEIDDTITAREIGQIIGTADLCGYDLDADKVAAVVSDKLASLDAFSRASFQTASRAQKVRIKDMSDLERKVTCATQAKVAETYGLLP